MKIYLTVLARISCLSLLAVLFYRAAMGSGPGVVSPRSGLNIAAFAFLSLVAVLLVREAKQQFSSLPTGVYSSTVLRSTLVIAAAGPYLIDIKAPLLFDDYVHLATAATRAPLEAVLQQTFLLHPNGGDGFFRPLGSFYYWFTFKWAGWNPTYWHASGLLIHAANTLLLYSLLKRNYEITIAAFGGALLFALHAAHIEAVSWTAASFDLLAAFFSLLALNLVSYQPPTLFRTLAVMLTGALACLSKESAYCLPLLSACLALLHAGSARRRMLRTSLWLALACTATFAYRIWYLQGIGGYRTSTGSAMVLSWHPLSILQAMLLRLWALLFIPINWSIAPEWWLRLATGLMLLSMVAAMIGAYRYRTASFRSLSIPLLFTLCAALPVFPLLLVGSDLAGARVLYLPSIGISLFWSVILMNQISPRVQRSAMAWFTFFLVFQFAALLHNEFIWRREANIASEACSTVAATLKQNPAAKAYAADLPRIRNGVFFLGNGFAECVSLAGGPGVSASRVSSGAQPPPNSTDAVFVWNNQHAQLERTK